MKQKKWFTKSDQDESSIFIEPYYCIEEKAERMTKSSFFAIVQTQKDS